MRSWLAVLPLIFCSGCSLLIEADRTAGDNDAAPPTIDAGSCPAYEVPSFEGACVECVSSGDCEQSQVCDRTSFECVDEAEVVYVEVDGPDTTGGTGGCTRAAPCATVGVGMTAVSESRTWLALGPGEHAIDQLVIDGDDYASAIKIYGMPGAIVIPTALTSGSLFLATNNGRLRVVGLQIFGKQGTDGDSSNTIACIASASLEVLDSQLFNGNPPAIRLVNCTASVRTTRISGYRGGGIQSYESNLDLISSLIDGNGNDSAFYGGVRIRQCQIGQGNDPDDPCLSTNLDIRILFTTIVANKANGTSDLVNRGAGALRCDKLSNPIEGAGSILQDNTGYYNIDITESQDSRCAFTNSIAPLRLDDLMPTDYASFSSEYELLDGSVGIDVPELAPLLDDPTVPSWDLAGGPRLVGAAPDMGALERD